MGHIQKLLGTALRQLKLRMRGTRLADEKKVGEGKRLTEKTIDQIQNHFGEAIRKNSGNSEVVQQDVWIVLNDMVQNETENLEQQQGYCSKDGWWNFLKSTYNYDNLIVV